MHFSDCCIYFLVLWTSLLASSN